MPPSARHADGIVNTAGPIAARGRTLSASRDHPHPGLAFRPYRGEPDVPSIVRIMNRSWEADLIDAITTEDSVRKEREHPTGFDPFTDDALVEMDGETIGYCHVSRRRTSDGLRVCSQHAFLLPEWRGKGLRERMLRRNQKRAGEIHAEDGRPERACIESYAAEPENDWKALLVHSGYEPGWHLFEMVRENLGDVPEIPLPKGLQVRRVQTSHYRTIWEATKEAMRDERNFNEEWWSEEEFGKSLESETFTPDLWQIAWDGENVVGGVHNFIDEAENRALGRKWGHTEQVFVCRPWRRKGLARALLARSLKVLAERGMEAATLDVDTANPSGALRLYTGLGYRKTRHFIFYRKPLS